LRRDGYISGTKANQEYINQGLFKIKLTPVKGEEALYPQTFMTPKGLDYIIKKYKGGELCLKETKSKKQAK
jgi:phage antirepressor YoqD-like protein